MFLLYKSATNKLCFSLINKKDEGNIRYLRLFYVYFIYKTGNLVSHVDNSNVHTNCNTVCHYYLSYRGSSKHNHLHSYDHKVCRKEVSPEFSLFPSHLHHLSLLNNMYFILSDDYILFTSFSNKRNYLLIFGNYYREI